MLLMVFDMRYLRIWTRGYLGSELKTVLDAVCENLEVGWGWKVIGIVEDSLSKLEIRSGLLLPNDWKLLYFTDTFSGV